MRVAICNAVLPEQAKQWLQKHRYLAPVYPCSSLSSYRLNQIYLWNNHKHIYKHFQQNKKLHSCVLNPNKTKIQYSSSSKYCLFLSEYYFSVTVGETFHNVQSNAFVTFKLHQNFITYYWQKFKLRNSECISDPVLSVLLPLLTEFGGGFQRVTGHVIGCQIFEVFLTCTTGHGRKLLWMMGSILSIDYWKPQQINILK